MMHTPQAFLGIRKEEITSLSLALIDRKSHGWLFPTLQAKGSSRQQTPFGTLEVK